MPAEPSTAQTNGGGDRPVPRGSVRVIPLGGLRQVGMNCLALEQRDTRVLVDCGVAFGGDEWGLDGYRPGFDAWLAAGPPLTAVVLTHGHEDHIGALPSLLARCAAPVFGPAYAIELCRRRLAEQGRSAHARAASELRVIAGGDRFAVGSFELEALSVVHSIPDALAFAVETDAGVIVHSGDFKLDAEAMAAGRGSQARCRQLGAAGVRLLLSDSTNSFEPGTSGAEATPAAAIAAIVGEATGRVVVGLFPSNGERLQAVGELARQHGRQLCLLGRSANRHAEVAAALGRLDWPSDLLVAPPAATAADGRAVLFVASGTQGEPRGALRQLADRTHPQVTLAPGDVVILSSRIIPGREPAVQAIVDGLLRQGVAVHSRRTDPRLHVSGHAHRDEQRQLIEWLAPELFVPVHGTREQLERHLELARAAGLSAAQTLLLDDGDALELSAAAATVRAGWAAAAPVALAGDRVVPPALVRERQRLARGGVVVVAVAFAQGRVLVQVHAPGVSADPDLLERLRAAVAAAVVSSRRRTTSALENAVRAAVRRELKDAGLARPQVLVSIAEPGA